MMKNGIDVTEIRRFAEMKNLEAFLKRAFTKEEQAYFATKKTPYESIAGHFAAKEAFSKYMGSGMRGFGLRDIEVLHDGMGKPYLKFLGSRAFVDVSISHSDTVAVAVVCGEENPMGGVYAEHIKEYQALLPKRHREMQKGDCGRLFILAGSKGMTGAAALCAEAAMRSGSGLVTVGTPASEQPVLAMKLTEAMTMALPDRNGCVCEEALDFVMEQAEKSDVCIIGPGLGKTADIRKLIEGILKQKKPLLIDADGLNALAGYMEIIASADNEIVLTPHLGEMSRLCGRSIQEIQENREAVAAEFAKKWGVTLLLKGADTVIASSRGEVHLNPSGNNGMASGGMGDVLSGVIGALMGQGLSGYHAAVLGAFLHGIAGDLAAGELGRFGMIAGDVVRYLPKAFLALERP